MITIDIELTEQQQLELERSAKQQGLTPAEFLLELYQIWQDYEWEKEVA